MNIQVTVNDIVANSLNAENAGVRVDWRATCMSLANIINNHVEGESACQNNGSAAAAETEPPAP